MEYNNDISIKIDDLPITTEAKVFYLTNCLRQGDYVEAQQEKGINSPKIMLDLEYIRRYYKINELAQRDMDLIIEELSEVGLNLQYRFQPGRDVLI